MPQRLIDLQDYPNRSKYDMSTVGRNTGVSVCVSLPCEQNYLDLHGGRSKVLSRTIAWFNLPPRKIRLVKPYVYSFLSHPRTGYNLCLQRFSRYLRWSVCHVFCPRTQECSSTVLQSPSPTAQIPPTVTVCTNHSLCHE